MYTRNECSIRYILFWWQNIKCKRKLLFILTFFWQKYAISYAQFVILKILLASFVNVVPSLMSYEISFLHFNSAISLATSNKLRSHNNTAVLSVRLRFRTKNSTCVFIYIYGNLRYIIREAKSSLKLGSAVYWVFNPLIMYIWQMSSP